MKVTKQVKNQKNASWILCVKFCVLIRLYNVFNLLFECSSVHFLEKFVILKSVCLFRFFVRYIIIFILKSHNMWLCVMPQRSHMYRLSYLHCSTKYPAFSYRSIDTTILWHLKLLYIYYTQWNYRVKSKPKIRILVLHAQHPRFSPEALRSWNPSFRHVCCTLYRTVSVVLQSPDLVVPCGFPLKSPYLTIPFTKLLCFVYCWIWITFESIGDTIVIQK